MRAIQWATTSSSLKVLPARELGEPYTCSHLASDAAGPSLVAQSTTGVHVHWHKRSNESQPVCFCCPWRDGTGVMPCNASAWIVSPTWADLWRPWNANFHFEKVMSLHSTRMESIWHLTTSHNNRAPLPFCSQMWTPNQNSCDQIKFTV